MLGVDGVVRAFDRFFPLVRSSFSFCAVALCFSFFGSRPFDGFIFRGTLKDVRSEVSCHSHAPPVCRFELFFHRVRPPFALLHEFNL